MMDVAGEDRSLLAAPDGYLVLLALVLLFGRLALGEPSQVLSRT